MNKPNVFISHWMPQAGVDMLREHCEVDYYDGIVPLTKRQLIDRAQGADALVTFMCDTIDADVVEACPDLKVVSSFGKGYDNIDIEACTKQDILVTINRDALTDSTADLAIGLLLALSRRILQGDRHIRDRQFRGWHAANCLGRDFHHAKLGVIGFGAIGQAIAKRAAGFDVELSYYDKERKPLAEAKHRAQYLELHDLLSHCDFVIVAVDLRHNNVHLLDTEQLRSMKRGSYLVNISRGSIVNEAAVAEALEQGWLEGYAADVFEFEDRLVASGMDYVHEELLLHEGRTVMTPHIGTGTVEAREQLAISSATQLLEALRGNRPIGAVNAVSGQRQLLVR